MRSLWPADATAEFKNFRVTILLIMSPCEKFKKHNDLRPDNIGARDFTLVKFSKI